MNLTDYAKEVHAANQQWWTDLSTGKCKERNRGELLMLIVTELAEALEGDRKGIPDTHLPQYPMFQVELIDALIRLLDLIGSEPMDAQLVYDEKMAFNATRADHKIENRILAGGKKY